MASIDTYIIDLNSYFRIAQSIHPLLHKTFGSKFKIIIHQYFERQYYKQSHLKSKFSWFNEAEYKSNRSKVFQVSHKQKAEIELTYDYIYEFQKEQRLNLLYDDIFCLAYAQVLGLTVITDDTGMKTVSDAYGIKIIDSLDLLKLMIDLKEIDEVKIKEIVEYWKYNSDLPKAFNSKFPKLFPKIKLSFLK